MHQKNETKTYGVITPSRRRFVQFAGAGIAMTLGGSLCRAADVKDKTPKVLKHGDNIQISGQGEEIVKRAYELGFKYEKQHGG